jgi:hypothetical protein
MENLKLQKKWKDITQEIINTPKCKAPYRSEVVQTRELLLFAQVILGKLEMGEKINFHEELFDKIMSEYYKRKKRLNL